MSRAEIRRKFDEIVAFAEVERFLDTPVKHYSSGMYVRLAFAVAAHLEPEILIVDEVLAVGDAQFQKKCLGKMREVSTNHGRTVLFVSHDMSAISALTQRCILLQKGAVHANGATYETLSRYFEFGASQVPVYEATGRDERSPFVRRVKVCTSHSPNVQAAGSEMKVEVTLHHPRPVTGACLSFQIINQTQQPATHVWLYDSDVPYARGAGTTVLTCTIPKVRLNVGHYTLRIYFSEPKGGRMFDMPDGICPFEVVRLDEMTEWGWRPDACVYHEECAWCIEEFNAPPTPKADRSHVPH
jgi:lipopolysaccharide transport system ATP-binding protein